MKIRKLPIILFIFLITCFLHSNLAKAYTCQYNGAGDGEIVGCGPFSIEVSKGTSSTNYVELYKSNIKFSTPGMQLNEFTVSDGWKYFATNELNGECPEAYYRKTFSGGNYYNMCDVHFGFGDWDYTQYDNYIFEYGTNLSDPIEEEPLVPEDKSDEFYWTAGIEGHSYYDAGGCKTGEPRNVYVSTLGKIIKACITSDTSAQPNIGISGPYISCGYAQYHEAFRAEIVNGEVKNIDTSNMYYAGVCYSIVVDLGPGSHNGSSGGSGTQEPTPELHGPRLDYTSLCSSNQGVKSAAKIVGYVLSIGKWIVAFIIIIFGVIDFSKAMVSSDEKAISKAASRLLKRFIAGVIAVVIPTLPIVLLNIIQVSQGIEKSSNFAACTKCVFDPFNSCD